MPCRHHTWSSSVIAEPRFALATPERSLGSRATGHWQHCVISEESPKSEADVNPDSALGIARMRVILSPLVGAVACDRVQFFSAARQSERGGCRRVDRCRAA